VSSRLSSTTAILFFLSFVFGRFVFDFIFIFTDLNYCCNTHTGTKYVPPHLRNSQSSGQEKDSGPRSSGGGGGGGGGRGSYNNDRRSSYGGKEEEDRQFEFSTSN
jgi:uncharacterized membrane protein YgcG